ELAGERGILIEMASRSRLDDIAHTEHHQGVAGYFHGRPAQRLEDILESCRPPALLLLLDGIQDPQNVGALIRSAEAVGADAVMAPAHGAAGRFLAAPSVPPGV